MTTAASSESSEGFEVQPLLRRAWQIFAQKPGLHVLAILLVAVGSVISIGILMGPLLVGYIRLIDAQIKGDDVELGAVVQGVQSFGPAVVTWLLLALAVTVASALVVLPGVIVAFMGGFSFWFVALDNKAALDALKGSWALTRGNVGSVLLVTLVGVALNFLGGLVVLGVLITGPVGIIFATVSFAELRE